MSKSPTPEELLLAPSGTYYVFVGGYGEFVTKSFVKKLPSPMNDINSVLFEGSEPGEFGSDNCQTWLTANEVEFVETVKLPEDLNDITTIGMYRPELGTRKIGKVRVELVDDGFPLALREVAKVMTWAQTAKGYKDHDWQNLPDAEVQLAAAASRHRTDHIIQRVVDGYDIVDCVDPESALLHKAHEAFGVLAQLELMLRGKFND